MGGTRKPFSRRPHRYRRPPKRHFLQRPFPQRGTQKRQKLHNNPYYNKYNKYDSKNKNKNKNKQKKATRMTNKNKNNNKTTTPTTTSTTSTTARTRTRTRTSK